MSRKEIIERMSYAFQPALCTFLYTIIIQRKPMLFFRKFSAQ